MTEVLGTKSVNEIAIQTAEYDGSPLSLALQKLEDTYLKQSQACLLVLHDTQPPLHHTLISFCIDSSVPNSSHRCVTEISTTAHESADPNIQNCDQLNSMLLQQILNSAFDKLWHVLYRSKGSGHTSQWSNEWLPTDRSVRHDCRRKYNDRQAPYFFCAITRSSLLSCPDQCQQRLQSLQPRVGISMHQKRAVNTRSWLVAACGTHTVMSCHTAWTPA